MNLIHDAKHVPMLGTKDEAQLSTRRYFSYHDYLKEKFGSKTYKVVLASGLTCPTRDGSISKDGCAFCDVRGSSSFHAKIGRGAEISEQLNDRIPSIRRRFRAEKLVAYFQSYTNTYSNVDYLREIYSEAIGHPEISALAIGTRPDCIPDNVIALLQEMAVIKPVFLELGVQSLHDETLNWLKRGHGSQASLDAIERLKLQAPNVDVCVHLMFGCPTESVGDIERAAIALGQTHISGVKLHQLMILEKTELADRFRKTPFNLVTLDQYAVLLKTFVEHLPGNIFIERLFATATHLSECIGPEWSKTRWAPHNYFRNYFEKEDVQQGRFTTLKPAMKSTKLRAF